MHRCLGWVLFVVLGLVGRAATAQQATRAKIVAVRAARMLDVKSGRIVGNATVIVEGEKIVAAGAGVVVPPGAEVIDLGDATLLPGLIDCHSHLMARIPRDRHGYELNLLTKSQAFRALEGAADAKLTLAAGFTSVRDVESEGSGYADVALRDAIEQGLVEGPRMMVATRGIAALGRYFPFAISSDVEGFPTGAQMVSGVEEARRAAREQLAHGADLLKVYADWYAETADRATLTPDELRAIVEEAHKRERKVAAHAESVEGIHNALAAGVDSIEHGSDADRSSLELIKQKHAFWVPTRAVLYGFLQTSKNAEMRRYFDEIVERGRKNLAIARKLGVRIAAGFDASTAEDQGHNANELIELHRLGMPAIDAIRAATIEAAALLGRQPDVGSLETGKYGDLIAVAGDPLADISELQRVKFVMKGGALVKNELPRK